MAGNTGRGGGKGCGGAWGGARRSAGGVSQPAGAQPRQSKTGETGTPIGGAGATVTGGAINRQMV
jgi:hypothetical protein